MWKNIVKPGRPQVTIWRIRIACWLAKSTKTHSEYITQGFSIAKLVPGTRLNITLYSYVYYLSVKLINYPELLGTLLYS
jgi:hypothetical protein